MELALPPPTQLSDPLLFTLISCLLLLLVQPQRAAQLHPDFRYTIAAHLCLDIDRHESMQRVYSEPPIRLDPLFDYLE